MCSANQSEMFGSNVLDPVFVMQLFKSIAFVCMLHYGSLPQWQWHYFKPSSHPLSLPSLALLSHSGQMPSSQDQAVSANPSPSQRHFQPLAGYPTSLPTPLLWPHPCQFWLITQSKRPLLPLQASHDLHASERATEMGRTVLLSFSV